MKTFFLFLRLRNHEKIDIDNTGFYTFHRVSSPHKPGLKILLIVIVIVIIILVLLGLSGALDNGGNTPLKLTRQTATIQVRVTH